MTAPTTSRPLRMLALVAAPLVMRRFGGATTPIPPLNAARELEEIDAACKLTDTPVAIDIQTEIATVESLNRAFGNVQGGFDIVHFSGHGSAGADGGSLVVEDTNDLGAARLISAPELRELLRANPCRLAFLSACHSEGLAAALLDLGVVHIVAINADDAILDDAARVFARRFYNVLLSGRAVQEAFDRAVQEVRSDDILRTLLDPQTFEPVSLTEAVKFRLLPTTAAVHAAPLAPALAPGEVRFRRPPWGQRTNLSIVPRGGAFFVGRQREMHAVTRTLLNNRCVLITGFGGMGKTALAEATGRWQHERARWPDGVVLVQLRNALRAADARLGITSALQEAGIVVGDLALLASSDAALVAALCDRNMLLILDDLDALLTHDPDGIYALLNQLLGTRALRLLLTSRPSVTRRIVHERIQLQRLSLDAALLAFHRYARPQTWGAFTERDQAALPELLTELDGYPFAIRLAAAYIQEQGCGIAGLLQRLRSTPRATLIYPGEAEERDTSLAATLDLSYHVLPEDAKSALLALALFPAGLSRAAARAILGEAGEAALNTLLRYAMAERHDDDTALTSGAEDRIVLHRFVLPEPARRYVEHHQDADLLDHYAPAALAYFYAFIVRVDSLISARGRAVQGRYVLTLEQPNWRRFLDWGYKHEQTQGNSQSAHATARLGNYWTLIGEKGTPTVLDRLGHALVAAQRLHDRLGEASVLKAIGDVQQFRTQNDAALASYQQALTLYRESGERLGEANVLRVIGGVQQFRKQSDVALASYQQALTLYCEIGDRLGEANVLMAIGDIQQFRSDCDVALVSYQQALTLYCEIGERVGEANVLKAIGDIQQFRSDCDAALVSYQQALTLYREIGERVGEANVLKAIGDVQQFRTQNDAALASYQQALTLYREIGDRLGEANVLKAIGDIQQFCTQSDAALANYQQALTLYRESGDRVGEANVLKAIGDVQQFRKQSDAALASYQQALTLYRESGSKQGEADVLKVIGDVQQFRGQSDAALASYQQALMLVREIGSKQGEANVLMAIGDVQQVRKQNDAALVSYQQALTLYRESGDRVGEANVLRAIGDVQQFRRQSDAALVSYQQALTLYRESGSKQGEANVLMGIGDVQQFRRQSDAALVSYQQALTLYRESGDLLGEANLIAAHSRLLIDSDPEESKRLLEQALQIRCVISDIYGEGADLGNYSITLLQRGRNAEALEYLQRARQLFFDRGLHELLPQTDRLLDRARATSNPALPLPADFQDRFNAAGVTDEASAQLLAAFLAVPDGAALAAFWQQVPLDLEDTFLAAVEAQITQAEQVGSTDLAEALRQRLDGLRQMRARQAEAAETSASANQPLFDFLNARSLEELQHLVESYPQLLTDAVEPIFAALREQYGDDQQRWAHIESRQALLQAFREQGIEPIIAQLRQASEQAPLIASFQHALDHYLELHQSAQQAEHDINAWQVVIEAGEALLAPEFAETPNVNWEALRENLASTYNTFANALHDIGDREAAIAAYDRAIALQPSFAIGRRNRAGILIELGRLDEATAEIAAAKALEPDAPRLAELEQTLEQARANTPSDMHEDNRPE